MRRVRYRRCSPDKKINVENYMIKSRDCLRETEDSCWRTRLCKDKYKYLNYFSILFACDHLFYMLNFNMKVHLFLYSRNMREYANLNDLENIPYIQLIGSNFDSCIAIIIIFSWMMWLLITQRRIEDVPHNLRRY